MIGSRIKEERARLGLTQPRFADIAMAAKRTIIDWEKDKSSPTAQQLLLLSNAGVDVNYIITGKNTGTDDLPPEEQMLLNGYRKLDTDKQKWLLSFLINGLELAPKQNDNQCRGGDDKTHNKLHNKNRDVIIGKNNMGSNNKVTKGGVYVEHNEQGYVAETQHFNR